MKEWLTWTSIVYRAAEWATKLIKKSIEILISQWEVFHPALHPQDATNTITKALESQEWLVSATPKVEILKIYRDLKAMSDFNSIKIKTTSCNNIKILINNIGNKMSIINRQLIMEADEIWECQGGTIVMTYLKDNK